MANSSVSLHEFAVKNGIKYFLVSFVDLLGVSRSKLVVSQAINKMQEDGAGFAGFAAHFDMSPADPDLFAVPDATSVIQLPWKKEVAWVASDLYMHGKLVAQAPRQALKALIEQAHLGGMKMKSGVECEFFLLSSGSGCELADKLDDAEKPCYDQGALMRSYEVISEILSCMEVLGWKPYQADHEDANGQFEINWEYDNCLATADKHVFFKFMVKSLAEKHGYKATFMPKPFLTRTGNGAHCHVSLWDRNSTTNLFVDKYGELGMSSIAYQFIAGILHNAKALTALLNPTVNSYKRIDGGNTLSGSSWAPYTISFTGNNRTHMIRIPEPGRFELRLADGAVNPYLLQAAILASGLYGIQNELQAGPRADWNGYKPPPQAKDLDTLPTTLIQALSELSTSLPLKEAFSKEFMEGYLKIQNEQWTSFKRHLSQWEIDHTLDC